MKKLFAFIITLALVLTLPMMAFATEEETYPSPTDKPLIVVDFDSYHSGDLGDVSKETVPVGTECTFVAPESEYDFIGFTVEGEYEVVSGGALIMGAEEVRATRTANRTLVLIANSDLLVTAYYDIDEDNTETTEPTESTVDDDEDGDSPQTGDDKLAFWIMAAIVVGIIGCVFAVEKLAVKKKD